MPVVRTDGRSLGRLVTWLPNFLGWVDLLTHGAPQARFARQSSAIIESFAFSPAWIAWIAQRARNSVSNISFLYILKQWRAFFARSDWLLNQWISSTIHWFTSSSYERATPNSRKLREKWLPSCCRNKQRNFTNNQTSCSRNTRKGTISHLHFG